MLIRKHIIRKKNSSSVVFCVLEQTFLAIEHQTSIIHRNKWNQSNLQSLFFRTHLMCVLKEIKQSKRDNATINLQEYASLFTDCEKKYIFVCQKQKLCWVRAV
jgi:hypothetical protein